MADDNLFSRKLSEFANWIGGIATTIAEPAVTPDPYYGDLARISNEIAKIDGRIARLRGAINEESARIAAEMAPYRTARHRMPRVTHISIKSMMHTRTQMEAAMRKEYEARAKLQSMLHAIEHTQSQRAVVSVMHEAHHNQAVLLTDYDVRDAEDMMEKHRDAEQRTAEVTHIMAARGLDDIDDDALDEEFATMFDAEPGAPERLPVLPDVVHTAPDAARARPAHAATHTELEELADFM